MADSPDTRMHWVDLIKGISVVLVVLLHASLTLPAVAGEGTAANWWNHAGTLLEPLRMPVFFLVSGMLAAGAVHRSWSHNRRRTWGIAYLYVLWTVILLIVTTLFLHQQTPIAAIVSLPGTLVFAASGYWYLFALVAFFVIARATRSWPPLVVVGAAAALNIFRPVTGQVLDGVLAPLHPGSLAPSMALNLVFFLVGVHFRPLMRRVSHLASWPAVAVLGTALLAAGIYRLTTPELWKHTFLPLSIGWIVWAIMAAHLATRSARVASLGAYLGARTLPIYVLQFPLLYLIGATLERTRPGVLDSTPAQMLYPLVLTAVITATALWLHAAVSSNSLRHLFAPPAWALDPIGTLRRVPDSVTPGQRTAAEAVLESGKPSPALH